MGHTNYFILIVTNKAFEIFKKYIKENNLQIVPKDPWWCETLHIDHDEGDQICIQTNVRNHDRETAITKAIRHVVNTCKQSEYFTGSFYEGEDDGDCKGKLYIWDTYEGNSVKDFSGKYNTSYRSSFCNVTNM